MVDGAEEQFVSFGEQGAQLTYGSYLRLTTLLDSQHLESDPPAHDELLFITIHQVYELWFKQLLHEAVSARDAMTAGELWWAQHLLQRMQVIERVLVHQIDVLETMTPQDFLEFRLRLAPASGFQSVQFRELEFLSGAKDPSYSAPGSPSRRSGTGSSTCSVRTASRARPTRRSWPRCATSPTTGRSTPPCGPSPRRCSSTTSWPRSGGRGT
jgi:tryptophan 2,3-dioxygenase